MQKILHCVFAFSYYQLTWIIVTLSIICRYGLLQWCTQGVSKGSADPPEILGGARLGRGTRPTTSASGPKGGQQGHIREGRKMRAAVSLLVSAGPGQVSHGGPPSGFPYRGPVVDFPTAGASRALVQRALDRFSLSLPNFNTAGPGWTVSRRVQTGPSVDRP